MRCDAATFAATSEAAVTLQAAAAAAITLTIEDAAAKAERHLSLSLFDGAGNLVWEHFGVIPDEPWRIEGLPVGTFRLLLRPAMANGLWPLANGLPTATVNREIVLREGERTAVHVVRPIVGRLRIDAMFDLPPNQARGRFEVHDAGGAYVATTAVFEVPDGWCESPEVIDLRDHSVVRPDLPVGTYTVVAECGPAGTIRRDVEVRAGETTTLTLRP